MSDDAIRVAQHVPAALESLRETDLSLVEMSAVFRVAAEACTQAQIVHEVSLAITKGRGT